jgi:hypothetical protein
MEGETGTGTTYRSDIHFMRNFFLEKQNGEMSQETKFYAELQLSNKRYTKENCVIYGLA